jgi:hypothetical protein
MGEFKINIDKDKNRLYLLLKGYFSEADVKKAADETISAVEKLSNGFDVVNDISEFVPASQEATAEIKRAQEFIMNHGVNRVVRITNDSNLLAKAQFSRKSREVGYDAMVFKTIADAEAFLDKNI